LAIAELKWQITADYEPGLLVSTKFQTERNIQMSCKCHVDKFIHTESTLLLQVIWLVGLPVSSIVCPAGHVLGQQLRAALRHLDFESLDMPQATEILINIWEWVKTM